MAVGLPWFILLFTLIVGARGGLISVKGYDAFKAQSAGAAKAVLLLVTVDCQFCAKVESEVSSKCAANPDIKCFIDNIGKTNDHDPSYNSSPVAPSFVPYVAFLAGGQVKSTLNVKNAANDIPQVDAGFAALGAK